MDDAILERETEQAIERVSDPGVKAGLRGRLDAALAALHSAGTEEEKAPHREKLEAIRSEALAAAPTGPGGTAGGTTGGSGGSPGTDPNQPFMSKAAFFVVTVLAFASFAFVFFYFDEPGADNFTSETSIRPLLVLTLIVAMLGFGGILIVRPLFAPVAVPQFTERFRLAREIFLVFAGTFGTIIGFYFGAEEDEESRRPPAVEVTYSAGRVTAAVTGGAAPFIGFYTPADGNGRVVQSTERALSFAVGATCPVGATVLVVDGAGRQADGTVDCTAPGSAPNTTAANGNAGTPAPAPASNAAGNAVNNVQ
ncbi:MAG TPA: hypothetical protein VF693_04650 [Allosphingosinicella sp.]|jgi:hypothetical protein